MIFAGLWFLGVPGADLVPVQTLGVPGAEALLAFGIFGVGAIAGVAGAGTTLLLPTNAGKLPCSFSSPS